MPDDARYSADDVKASCQQWVREGRSWADLVENTLELVARATENCRHRRLSWAESNMAGNMFVYHLQMLDELHRNGDAYYGYRAGLNLWSKQMARIWAAIRKAQQVFAERLADQSPGAKHGEAQLSAKDTLGTDRNVETSGLPRLSDFPIANGFAKDDSGKLLGDMTEELRLVSPEHELEYEGYGGGYLGMVHILAHATKDLRKQPNLSGLPGF